MFRTALLVMGLTRLLLADSGTVVFHQRAGDFEVTLFSKSEMVRGGANDLSVMVQRPDNSTVLDATVLIRLQHLQSDGGIMRITGVATHAKATNKMLYASDVNIPETGPWQVNVDVSSGGKDGVAMGRINVLPPQPPVENYWPLVAMVPLLMIAFVINRKLREKMRARRRV